MLWISAVIAFGFGIITLVGIMPFLRKRIVEAEAQADARCAAVSGLHRIILFLGDCCGKLGLQAVCGSTVPIVCLCFAAAQCEAAAVYPLQQQGTASGWWAC